MSTAKPAAAEPSKHTVTADQASISLLDQIIDQQQATSALRYLPIMKPEIAAARTVALVKLKECTLREGVDYGKPPGTERGDGNKPDVLLKPGAEKLCSYFGYTPVYEVLVGSIEDWTGDQHNGEALFYYHVSCTLMKDGSPVGSGSGSCNSWESKYRYRAAGRACPECDNATALIRGKAEWEKDPEYKRRGSWICYEKKGGCGAKFFGDDASIMGQQVGQVANDKIYDLVNTVRKMADKRAYIAATLSATGASQFFSQDLDDMPEGIIQGTREDQKKIADAKIAEAEARKGAGGSAPKPEAQPEPKGPVQTGAQAEDPDELKTTLLNYTRGDAQTRKAIATQLLDMLVSKNAAPRSKDILAQFGVAFPTDLDEVGKQQACIREIWLAVAEVWDN